jgi:hypothetical protein
MNTKDMLLPVLPDNIKVQIFLIEDVFLQYEKKDNETGQFMKVRRRGYGKSFTYTLSQVIINKDGLRQTKAMKKMLSYNDYLILLRRRDENRQPLIKCKNESK